MNSNSAALADDLHSSLRSETAEKNKIARRKRIQARLEAAARAKSIAEGTYIPPIPEKPLLEEVIETSQENLTRLYEEGKEQITNIIVASDSQEVERREREIREKDERLKNLREESAMAMERLEKISERWNTIMETTGPSELHEKMNEQKANCLKMIEQKNELIKNFQMELKLADEKYVKDWKDMYKELALLTKRIDEQVLIMKKAYRIELENVEEAIEETRTELIEQHQRKWLALYNRREKEEVKNMERKFNLVENFHDELHQLHIDHEENYRQMKIQLEMDVQSLELELEQVKALCFLNSEKLDYNYQILKKREEENLYIKNHQKRRLNKLQDMSNMLKKKINKKRGDTDQELKKLMKEVHRYHANLMEMEKKGDHFMIANEDKFQGIWEMNDQEAKDLLNKILAADKVIHEQILGVPWAPPSVTGIKKSDMPSYRTAEVFVKEQKKASDPASSVDSTEQTTPPDIMRAQTRVLHRVMQAVSNRTGFLVEEKVDELLKPYTDEEKTFVRLDYVCVALGIQKEKDVKQLLNAFMPYTTCLICSGKKSMESIDFQEEMPKSGGTSVLQITELEEKVSKLRIQAKDVAGSTKEILAPTSYNPSVISSKLSGPVKKTRNISGRTPRFISLKSSEKICDYRHPLIVEKYNVLKALKDFVSKYRADRIKMMAGIEQKLQKKRYTISRLLSFDEINTYWERYNDLLPQKLQTTWNSIYGGLKRYLEVLKDRHKLNMEAQALRRQNRELKRLLALYKTPQNQNELTLPVVPTVPADPIDFMEIVAISQKLSL